MTIYHVRPMDLHTPSEYCNTYDCTTVMMRHDYDVLAARLVEAERLLAAVYSEPSVNACCEHVEAGRSWFESRDAFLRTTDSASLPDLNGAPCPHCGGSPAPSGHKQDCPIFAVSAPERTPECDTCGKPLICDDCNV